MKRDALVDLLVDAQATLGECVLWCDQVQALYWTDIEGSTVSRWQAADGAVRVWTLPDRVGSFALCQQPQQLLLGLAAGIALFDLESGALSPVIAVEPDQPTTRINDGRCDAQGRFVFGMFNPALAPIGHFYRVGPGLQVERLALPPAAVANSIAFSPDGTRLYFADSASRQIHCADYHADGRIGNPRLFARVPQGEPGAPDGSTVDADGGLWNARWDAGCVVRYGSDGVETVRIALPATRPTSIAFGGAALDRLFVSSARIGLDENALSAQPAAGGVFEVKPGRRGLPEHRFVIAER